MLSLCSWVCGTTLTNPTLLLQPNEYNHTTAGRSLHVVCV
jgi:hypothetical protein